MKKLTATILTIAFIMGSAGMSMAASAKCVVTEIKDNIVSMDCGDKAEKMKVGDNLKVKIAKKQAVEGC